MSREGKMNFNKFSPRLLLGIIIALFVLIALSFRVFLPYQQVFVDEWIKFTSIDAYFQMRLVDNLVHHFPYMMNFDPYFIFPGGYLVGDIHFFNWLLAFICWVIGLGHPSQHLVDVIGVYFPAILAALTVIPVYFIGKTLFNRWAGIIAAALFAVLPGEYLGRSILGFTDQHVAETLFSAVAVLFLIMGVKTAKQRGLTFNHLLSRDWSVITRPLVYALLAGFFLGIYLITWAGALLFVFIIAFYLIVQFIIDHIRGQSTDYLGITGIILFFIALIIYLPFSLAGYFTAALVCAVLIVVALSGVSRLMAARGFRPVYYPLALVGLAVVFLGLFYVIDPSMVKTMFSQFGIFAPTGATATTTLEMQPFLSPQGSFSTAVAWGNFTTSFFLAPSWPIPGFALISLVILIWFYVRKRSDDKNLPLFIIWSLVILIATLVQRRFAYYLVVNIALLSAYLCWQAIWYAGLRRLASKPDIVKEGPHREKIKDKRKEKRKESRGITIYHVNVVLAIIVVFFFVFFPNITKSKEVAAQARFAPSDAWMASLTWMRDNTPEPLGDLDAYYKLYEPPLPGENFTYLRSAYGVTSWWDYGYWISRIAHRIPSANPSQAPKPIKKVASLFLSQDKSEAREIIDELKSSYIILDSATCTSKFWAVTTWAGEDEDKHIGTYYLPYEGQLVELRLFHTEYYNSLCVRLFNFDGEAVTGESPAVVSYQEQVDRQGHSFKQITDIQEFDSYQEAVEYMESDNSVEHKIIGLHPFISPISMEAVEDYKLIYSSEYGITDQNLGLIPEVKIFEYIPQE